MASFYQIQCRRFSGLQKIVVACVFVCVISICQPGGAQEIIYNSNSADFGSLSNWPNWHCLWNRNNGYPKDGAAWIKGRKHLQYRVPVHPPVDTPSCGYYQTCWKQLPVASRCLTCEPAKYDGNPVPYESPSVPEEEDRKPDVEGDEPQEGKLKNTVSEIPPSPNASVKSAKTLQSAQISRRARLISLPVAGRD